LQWIGIEQRFTIMKDILDYNEIGSIRL